MGTSIQYMEDLLITQFIVLLFKLGTLTYSSRFVETNSRLHSYEYK